MEGKVVMISSVFALAMAAASMQASDATRSARQAFTTCLRNYVDASISENRTADAFNTAYPQQCTQQEAAFRQAILARENAARATRASAEQTANDEIADARTNFKERFEMSMAPQ